MIKKILIITILCIMIFQSSVFAVETEGEVIFRDALYGAAIGAILGGAFYLADDREGFAEKFGVGVAIGTLAGVFFGVVETKSLIEVKNDRIEIAVPTPLIKKKQDGSFQYSALLFKKEF
jgi:hypothetical protein